MKNDTPNTVISNQIQIFKFAMFLCLWYLKTFPNTIFVFMSVATNI